MRKSILKRAAVKINILFKITHWKYIGEYRYCRKGVQACTGTDAGVMGGLSFEWEWVNLTFKDIKQLNQIA